MTTRQESSLPTANRIPSQLSTEEYERISPHLEFFTLTLGDILQYPKSLLHMFTFPIAERCQLSQRLKKAMASK